MNLMKKQKNCLTLTMWSLKVHVIIGGGKAPERNLKGCDDSGQNYLDQGVNSVSPSPADTNMGPSSSGVSPLFGPDMIQHNLQEHLYEGNQQAVDHPDIHHLHARGFG